MCGPGGSVRCSRRPGDFDTERHQELERVRNRPDAPILYSGHNEYQARLAWDQDGDVPIGILPFLLKVVMGEGLGSPFFRAVTEASSKDRLMAPPRIVHHGLIERPIVRRAVSERLRHDFGRRLDAIVSRGEP